MGLLADRCTSATAGIRVRRLLLGGLGCRGFELRPLAALLDPFFPMVFLLGRKSLRFRFKGLGPKIIPYQTRACSEITGNPSRGWVSGVHLSDHNRVIGGWRA